MCIGLVSVRVFERFATLVTLLLLLLFLLPYILMYKSKNFGQIFAIQVER